MDLIDMYTTILERIRAADDVVQDAAINLEGIAHTTFAAGTYATFPDSLDLYELAHEVRNCAVRAAIELAEMSSAMESLESYIEERRAYKEDLRRDVSRTD